MEKNYFALGLMSGTSGDGVDSSIIQSNGKDKCLVKWNNYDPYPPDLSKEIHSIKEKVQRSSDLIKYFDEIKILEAKITTFHANVAKKCINSNYIDFIGFHGQTIFHNSEERISKQLGLGEQLSYITKKTVIYNFRQNDLKNGGEGAPLTPVYHQLLVKTFEDSKKLKLPVTILNIGGIANITTFDKEHEMTSMDIGPGNCLIDKWIRLNSNKEFDENGDIAKSGKIDKIILEQALDNFYQNNISKKKSLDTNDFDISFVRGLSLENGAATLTEITAEILSKKILDNDIYVCGGGRKNKFLINLIQKKIQHKIREIDYLGIDGGFIESQAFGYLAIRSYLGLPISFPETTGCKESSTGGLIVKNF
jgi:anhydro-N-acetylmuramic acid kinase